MGYVPAMASIKATPLVSHCLTLEFEIHRFFRGMDMLANEWIQAGFIYVATYIGQVGKWRLKGYKNPRGLRQRQEVAMLQWDKGRKEIGWDICLFLFPTFSLNSHHAIF